MKYRKSKELVAKQIAEENVQERPWSIPLS